MILSLVLAVLASPADDVRSALARLGSESGAERVDAERWLAANLSASDLSAVAETATTGAIEVRARLIHALGSEQRHFELAMLLTLDREPVVRRMGREAIETMAARWFGKSDLPPQTDVLLEDQLRGRFLGRYSVRPFEHDLVELIDLLVRAGPPVLGGTFESGELALAIDPLLYAEPPDATLRAQANADADQLASGSFDQVLFASLEGRAARLQGFGFDGAHPWLCVVHSPDAGQTSGVELLLRWCRDVLDYAERPRGAGAARAIAACGWPAPFAWLEKRWVSAHDRNALAGLLLAASRGRVAGSLCTDAAVAELLALADAASRNEAEHSPEFARDVIAALCRFPSLGRRGEDLTAPVLAGWANASESERAARAHVLAGMRRAGEPWRAQVQAELARNDGGWASAATRLAYLKALAATAGSSATPQRWALACDEAMLVRVVRDRAQSQFLAWTQRTAARPPDAWREAKAVASLHRAERTLVITWWSTQDADLDVAARLARAWLAAGESPIQLGDAFASRVRLGERARIGQLCERLSKLGDASSRAAIERVAVVAGLVSDGRCKELVAALVDAQTQDAGELATLGAALGADVGKELVERAVKYLGDEAKRELKVSSTAEAPWSDACERAVVGLRARGAPADAQKLVNALRSALRGNDAHPLSKPLRKGVWPPPAGADPIALEAVDVLWPR